MRGGAVIPPIEIKINLGTDVDGVLGALGCADSPAVRRDVWFAESRAGGQDGALALLGSGIVIRLRSGDLDDLTVTLRPCRRSQLMGRWAKPFTARSPPRCSASARPDRWPRWRAPAST